MNFGRVDGETDNRFESCFIGTEMLRQVLLPQHSLIVGNKGSGKSAICRLLCDDLQKVKPLLPKNFDDVYCIPAYGLQNEEFFPALDSLEIRPETVDDFRYHWLLYLGLKLSRWLVEDERLKTMIEQGKDEEVKRAFATLHRALMDVELIDNPGVFTKLKHRFTIKQSPDKNKRERKSGTEEKPYNAEFREKTGMSIIALLENVDTVLRGTNRLAWLMLDKLDLLYVDDITKLRASITGLVQLLVQYGNQFKNIHFKIFLRNDIYRQLHIVNKSHLISYTTEMRWRGPLLLKLLAARAIVDSNVREYCSQIIGSKIDITDVILGSDDYVKKIFYAIFEDTMVGAGLQENAPATDQWILRRLIDGTESSFPRELIHLGNKAVEMQRELNRSAAEHRSARLISPKALREAFHEISKYRCDTYLYSEFPHLSKHFDVFRGSDTTTFHREELYMLFEPLSPKSDEAIRALYDTGILHPLGKNVDSSRKFSVPLLYRSGLGMTDRSKSSHPRHRKHHGQKSMDKNSDERTVQEYPKMN